MKHRLYLDETPHDVWLAASGNTYVLQWNGAPYPVASEVGTVVVLDRDTVHIHLDGRSHAVRYQDALSLFTSSVTEGSAVVRAPMPGVVIAVRVNVGDAVTAGQPLLVIESMKLETVVRTPIVATVDSLNFAVGQTFARDAVLATLAVVGT